MPSTPGSVNPMVFPEQDTRVYPAGAVILRQGESSQEMFIIGEGRVQVTLEAHHGPSIPLATLGPGDFFGEMSFFGEKSRSATVSAATDVRVYTVDRAAIENKLKASPRWFREIVIKLIERVRYANLAILDQAASQSGILQIERLNAALSVIGALAHEINQPLTVLIAATQLLEQKLGDTDHMKTTQTIVQNSQKVAEILKKLQSIRCFVTKPYAGSNFQILDIDRALASPPDDDTSQEGSDGA